MSPEPSMTNDNLFQNSLDGNLSKDWNISTWWVSNIAFFYLISSTLTVCWMPRRIELVLVSWVWGMKAEVIGYRPTHIYLPITSLILCLKVISLWFGTDFMASKIFCSLYSTHLSLWGLVILLIWEITAWDAAST